MDRMTINNKPRLQQICRILSDRIKIDSADDSPKSFSSVLAKWVADYEPKDIDIVVWVAKRVCFMLEDWAQYGDVRFKSNEICLKDPLNAALRVFYSQQQ